MPIFAVVLFLIIAKKQNREINVKRSRGDNAVVNRERGGKTNDEAVLERNLLLAPKQEKLLNKHEEAILFSELSMFSR